MMHMHDRVAMALVVSLTAGHVSAADMQGHEMQQHEMEDKLPFTTVEVTELEWRDGDGEGSMTWDAEAYYGDSLHRFGIESEGERTEGVTEHADAALLYRQAVAPFWDLKAGWRHDFQPHPQRDWLALGVEGLMPFEIATEAMLYVGDNSRSLFELKLSYELLLTQRLAFEPELKLQAAGQQDRDTGIGEGITHVETGLRLHYAVTRKLSPYIGVVWERACGDTADLRRDAGEQVERLRWNAGVSFWF